MAAAPLARGDGLRGMVSGCSGVFRRLEQFSIFPTWNGMEKRVRKGMLGRKQDICLQRASEQMGAWSTSKIFASHTGSAEFAKEIASLLRRYGIPMPYLASRMRWIDSTQQLASAISTIPYSEYYATYFLCSHTNPHDVYDQPVHRIGEPSHCRGYLSLVC